MPLVAHRTTLGVDPGRRDPVRKPVLHHAGPTPRLEAAVVVATDQRQVVQVGEPATMPRDNMVTLGPRRRAVTSWERATAVPRRQRDGLTRRRDPAGATQPQRDVLGV